MNKPSYLIILNLIFISLNLVESQMYWDKLYDNLSYKPSDKPPPRRDAAIGFDIDRQRVIVFGGWQNNPSNADINSFTMPVLFDDTWEYNLQSSITILIQN